jgi:hypothetical protein
MTPMDVIIYHNPRFIQADESKCSYSKSATVPNSGRRGVHTSESKLTKAFEGGSPALTCQKKQIYDEQTGQSGGGPTFAEAVINYVQKGGEHRLSHC